MSFLDTFKLYDKAMLDEQGNLQIIAEYYDYHSGNFKTTDDGRVDCTDELIPYVGENVDELFKGTDLDAGFFTTELGDVNPTFISPEGSFGGNIDINRSQLSKDALGSLPEGFWKG